MYTSRKIAILIHKKINNKVSETLIPSMITQYLYYKPKAKYKIGTWIVKGRTGGRICYRKWSEEYKEWLYTYDYGLGLTSEGSMLESRIILKNNLFNNNV